MAIVSLPCDYEEWWDYQKIFILLSHLRSVQDLSLLISSHTRRDDIPTTISRCMEALKGLMAFLTNFCTGEEQKKFFTTTLPFIARSASLLEERVPSSGIPYLLNQENSALVLGRKVIASILSNAFLCTFMGLPENSGDFNFENFFAVFLGEDEKMKGYQADKLRCILCYFEATASERCNLSAVITYRRQVLSKGLPAIAEWQNNSLPLCPFEVDRENCVERSGGHTLQVCSVGGNVGGGVLGGRCGKEEVRFLICPELLIAQLVMADMEINEAIIVTGTEQFSSCSGVGPTFKFAGLYKDESERDVFGNLLNSLVALDSAPFLQAKYGPGSISRQLNKSYTAFFCQQDRGDISTELLAMTVKRGSLAFVAEDYPECGAPFKITSRQSDLGNVHLNIEGDGGSSQSVKAPPPVSIPVMMEGVGAASSPLSPIPEISETPSYPTLLAADILESSVQQVKGGAKKKQPPGSSTGVEEEMATEMVNSLFEGAAAEIIGNKGDGARESFSAPGISQSVDDLASTLSSSILKNGLTLSAKVAGETIEDKSGVLAMSIISDVLTSPDIHPATHTLGAPQTLGEASGSASDEPEEISSMAFELTGSILSDAIHRATSPDTDRAILHHPRASSPHHPVIYVETERRGSVESGRSSRSSSLTGQAITVHEYVNELAEETIREGISIMQYAAQGAQGQEAKQEEEKEKDISPELDALADSIVGGFMQDVCPSPTKDEPPPGPPHSSSSGSPKTQPSPGPQGSRKGLPLSAPGSSSSLTGPGARSSTLPEPSNPLPGPSSTPQLADQTAETPAGGLNLNARLLTPVSSRTGYAWSIASTRDEDSRPVSPTDLNKIGLSLSNDTEEFSSLFSNIVISNAICNVTGESLSPHAIPPGKEDSSLPNSSKIGRYLSGLGKAEPLSADGAVQAPPPADTSSAWQNMRKQLLRPIATGSWGCEEGEVEGGVEQVSAMVQWMAASACGRPRLFYYSYKGESLQELEQVVSLLRTKFCTVGQLCRILVAFSKLPAEEQKSGLFSFLLKNYS